MKAVNVISADTGVTSPMTIDTSDVLVFLKDRDYIRGVAIIEGGDKAVPVYWDPMKESWAPTGKSTGDAGVLHLDLVRRGYELVPDMLMTELPELPTARTIFQDLVDGDCTSVCGCVVEPDGYCEHGLPASATYYCGL